MENGTKTSCVTAFHAGFISAVYIISSAAANLTVVPYACNCQTAIQLGLMNHS